MRKRNSSTIPAVDQPAAAAQAVIAKFSPAIVAAPARAAKRRGPGRPRIGKGAKRVLVTVERGLLEQADAYAQRHHVTRSHLICDALRAIVTAEQKHRPGTASVPSTTSAA